MQLIQPESVQRVLQTLQDRPLYLHLEMTTGAYASHRDKSKITASAFVSNTVIRYSHGTIAGQGPYRVGLKTPEGWVYAEGLTHWDENEPNRLIMAGHDQQGRLIVSLQLSKEPF
ncbi:YojF family protein [Paenibacillus apiarius]|uniref:YojF family protein n=1 Tax=Paenibacillus apiarius TaxID=46240 RepID=A0ABT4DW58_9BACL|nr:YojF family protein [Paenibacillus apiarius]MBN3526731.1 YojF family protein [Paenibacillus apiarius]MCY9513162.1 YojF family protein [Paenibacillus apiarius]MCY9521480.1 YojF family protein [Paenibacillus apiarius]MCY9551635.1 YojF family protein [Paenibacillus apiarius]MCY9560578.1 YojF family protein [Paenibacillus apiarius]